MMRIAMLLIVLTVMVVSMPDDMCFVPDYSSTARIELGRSETESGRACHVLCADNAQCLSVRHSHPTCVLLGDYSPTELCGVDTNVDQKQTGNCPAREPSYEIEDGDTCMNGVYSGDFTLDRAGVCGRTSSVPFVIRGIAENGNFVTLDNNNDNIVSYDAARNLFKFSYPPTGFALWLTAITCTHPSPACPCLSLEMNSPGTPGFVPAQTEVVGTCADTSHYLYISEGKGSVPRTSWNPVQQIKMTITCRTGIWILVEENNFNEYEIVDASCGP
ncbi:hypothetical protein PMAYCL1PPCAC_00765 [Pristionchus mayeri]|uniref:Apple domain-containing protein n=1 Tax=Pristionchus mayeri TaxID=1317129 RepID=A0AAN4Z4K2_9BILA|nr:hypothetical protein PMAYCL1PPCAC_00765 [Pristionchus mayeri]